MDSISLETPTGGTVDIGHADSATRISIGQFLALAVQLGLVLGVAVLYRIELAQGFGMLAPVIFLGFLAHSWLPMRIRLPFFLLLTLAAIALQLRWDGLWLVALGLALLMLCHLRISWSLRVVLVLLFGVGLGALRLGWGEVSWASAVIPVLAAMFMFRIILYLHDLKDENTPATSWQRLAYFFLLPNVCFPLFPVVDYKTFLRSYYSAPAIDVYQKGIYWIYRGIGHLLLYRFVYYLMPRVDEGYNGVLGVFLFMAMTYGLYLRVSGLFHLIVGSLCLFGFNLPQTNNNYFLASSFNDLWRRINIYWKDFMMSVVFYPVFLGTRRWRMSYRLVLATGIVFVITWFLHSYQWFWLQGVFPVKGTDIAFWGFLGMALAVNSVWEARRGRRRMKQSGWSWGSAMAHMIRTLGVFTVMAIVWSLWYSESFADWGYRLLRVRESTAVDVVLLGLLVFGVLGLGVIGQWLSTRGWSWERLEQVGRRKASSLAPIGAVGLLLIWSPVNPDQARGALQRVVSRLSSTAPNRIDRERQERGYYETLSRSAQFAPAEGAAVPDELTLNESDFMRSTGDLRGLELVPDVEFQFKGESFRTNRWGMRDRDYDRSKTQSTYRIAVQGASYVMGQGVATHETFENIVEDRLNGELAGQGFQRFEVLNFAVGGYGVLQNLYVAERIIPEFTPDAVIYIVHPGEEVRLVQRLRLALKQGAVLDSSHDYLADVLEKTGAQAGLPSTEFTRRLKPRGQELLRWAYEREVQAILSQGAVPVFVFLPLIDSEFPEEELKKLTGLALEAGARVVVLEDVYGSYSLEQLRITEWDNHPNAMGHEMIGDKLYQVLRDNDDALGLVGDID